MYSISNFVWAAAAPNANEHISYKMSLINFLSFGVGVNYHIRDHLYVLTKPSPENLK